MPTFGRVNFNLLMGGAILIGCVSMGVGYLNFAFTRAYAEEQALPQAGPVTVSIASEDDMSFNASAQRGASRATVVVRRKGLHDKDFVRNPEVDSPYDVEVIVYNRYGYPLAMNIAGDIPVIDSMTGKVAGKQSSQAFGNPVHLDQTEQLEDLQTMVDMVKSLRANPAIGEKFRWEIRLVENMGQWGLEHANDSIAGLVRPQSTPRLQNGSDFVFSTSFVNLSNPFVLNIVNSGDYIYQAYIRWSTCCVSFGHHSAVLVNVYYQSTGVFVLAVSSSNHGTEAIDSSMTTASGCPQAWGGRTLAIPQFQPYIATDTYGTGDAGGCGTPYLASPYVPGVHVCNDDSLAEYWNLKYNTQGVWATCSDATLRQWEPSCD